MSHHAQPPLLGIYPVEVKNCLLKELHKILISASFQAGNSPTQGPIEWQWIINEIILRNKKKPSVDTCSSIEKHQKPVRVERRDTGRARWLTAVIPALGEAEGGGS